MIRPAHPSDVPALLALISELARFEREPDAAQASPGDLEHWLFGDEPAAGAFVAEATGRVVGMAIWFRTFSTWTGQPGLHLEDLFVLPAHRGRGLGRDLFRAVAGEAVARGYPRMEWAVLDWNAPAQDFYRTFGAEPLAAWQIWRLSGPALAATAGDRSTRPLRPPP